MRSREGMKIASEKGKQRGKKPKLLDKQQRELRKMYDSGDYNVSNPGRAVLGVTPKMLKRFQAICC